VLWYKHKLWQEFERGQAVLVYGEPRLTRDIDITLGEDFGIWFQQVWQESERKQ
jgi:hypothetical protein